MAVPAFVSLIKNVMVPPPGLGEMVAVRLVFAVP